MSIRTSFNPMGTLGNIEILDAYTVFNGGITGIEASGVTMEKSQHFRTVLDFSIIEWPPSGISYWPTLYQFANSGHDGRWMAFWNINYRKVYWENNTGRFAAQSSNLSLGAHTAEVTGRAVKIDGTVIGTSDAVVYESGTGYVKPNFLSASAFKFFAIKRFDFFVDDVLVQRYLPAKRNGDLGLYETVSKTFCKQS